MKFRVVVNGKEYLVEVEEIEGEISVKSLEFVESVKSTPEVQPEVKPEVKVEEKPPEVKPEVPKAPAPAGGNVVKAPLPGKVTRVLVKPGDKVSAGDVLLYIEAMKMENEIVAPSEGEVAQVFVKPGDVVETDQPLVEIR